MEIIIGLCKIASVILIMAGILAGAVWLALIPPKFGAQGKSVPSRQWSTIFQKFHGYPMPGDKGAPPKNGEAGFSTVGFIIVAVILCTIAVGSSIFFNNRAATEKRAYQGAAGFIAMNGLADKIERKTCAGDADGDGYGTCTIKLIGENPIKLECPTNWLDIKMGATSCKEVIHVMNMMTTSGGAVQAPAN